ncbi:hypothetical protein VPH35_114015 [Triticum aestivum]
MATLVQWTDLPDDLLHLVYLKVGGLLHRLRFAAVSRSWRAAAIASKHAVPPTLPWLLFSSLHGDDGKTMRLYYPEDGGVLHIRPKNEALIGKRLVGAHDGGWVAALGDDMQLVVVNLFSGVEVPLHAKNMRKVYTGAKIVFSESPKSGECILATITPRRSVALCKIGCRADRWTAKIFSGPMLADIIFYNGKLYGLTRSYNLIKFNIGLNKHGRPVATIDVELHIRIGSQPSFVCHKSIVELHGTLALVLRINPSYGTKCEPFFKVFVLADESMTKYTHKWEEVTSLDDCALFLGKMSKAVDVRAVGRGGVERGHIYADDMTYLTSLDGHGSRVYPMQDESIYNVPRRIKSAGSYVAAGAPTGMWVLPPDI